MYILAYNFSLPASVILEVYIYMYVSHACKSRGMVNIVDWLSFIGAIIPVNVEEMKGIWDCVISITTYLADLLSPDEYFRIILVL